MLIKTNGLGATLAFIKAKGSKNEAYQLLYDQTAEWFMRQGKDLIELVRDDDLVEKIVGLNSTAYRVATREVLALFFWLRRFAEGLIEGEAEPMTEQGQIKGIFPIGVWVFAWKKEDVFFHISNYDEEGTPMEGDWVEFS